MASSAPQRAEGVPLLELTPAQLAAFTGADGVSPIYICLSGVIYDVSSGRDFYGPGGNYHVFAGRDASQPLATMDIKSVVRLIIFRKHSQLVPQSLR
jgi:membrane-associated progesterone receptor component